METNFYIELFDDNKTVIIAEYLDYQHIDYFLKKAIDDFAKNYGKKPKKGKYKHKNEKWVDIDIELFTKK